MIKQLVSSAALAVGALGLVACEGSAEVEYAQPAPGYYVEPGPAAGFYEGGVYYYNFDDYWSHHHDWDRDRAYREWQAHPREYRRGEMREERREERHEHER